jgi:hypothetical protein
MFLPHAVAAADREPTFDPPLVAAEGRAKLSADDLLLVCVDQFKEGIIDFFCGLPAMGGTI